MEKKLWVAKVVDKYIGAGNAFIKADHLEEAEKKLKMHFPFAEISKPEIVTTVVQN